MIGVFRASINREEIKSADATAPKFLLLARWIDQRLQRRKGMRLLPTRRIIYSQSEEAALLRFT